MLRVLTGALAVALGQLLNNRSLTFMVFFAFSVKENFYVLPFSLVLKSLRHHLVLVHWKTERQAKENFLLLSHRNNYIFILTKFIEILFII